MTLTHRRATVVTALAALAPVALAAPAADAHIQRGLDARILTLRSGCPPQSSPLCLAAGRIRIINNRPQPAVICVGIGVHTARHRDLSIEGPSRRGQASARVGPRSSKVTTYDVVYNSAAGRPHHIHITGVHSGGQPC